MFNAPKPVAVPGKGVPAAGLSSASNSFFFVCELGGAGVGGVAGMEKPTTEEVGRAFLVGTEDEDPEVLEEGCRRDAHDRFKGG